MERTKRFEAIQKIVFFGLALGEAIEHATQRESHLAKAACLLEVIDETLDLLSIDRSELEYEFDNLSQADMDELMAVSKERFDLGDDALEAKIERTFDYALTIINSFHGLYKVWKR
jgi:hypothetical protein